MQKTANDNRTGVSPRSAWLTVLAFIIVAASALLAGSAGRTGETGAVSPTEPGMTEVEALGEFETHAQAATYLVRAEKYLTLRSQPSAQGEEIGRILPGKEVQVLDWQGAYYLVRVAETGQEGFVLGGYLVSTQPDAFITSGGIVDVTRQQYGYDEMTADLEELNKRYPDLLSLSVIGVSLDGRDIRVAVAGNPQAARHILIQACIHGREYMSALLVMKQLEYFLSEYATGAYDDPELSYMKNTAFHVVPMSNPDGAEISMRGPGAITDITLRNGLLSIYHADIEKTETKPAREQYYRKWKANARGVDLNLNFDAGWNELTGAEAASSSGYPGPAPASEPESQALINYAQLFVFDATISYHAYGSGYYWDYRQRGRLRDQTRSLAWLVQSVTGYLSLEDLMGEPSGGGFKDWAIECLRIPSLTVEIGTTSSPLDIREFPTIWERNRGVWETIARWAENGRRIG